MDLKDNPLLVAAIDFGTTYSGYAYSTKHDYLTDPQTIHTVIWYTGSEGIAYPKTSTCVLFKPDETFHSFGYEAEDYYNDLVLDAEHKDWLFFRHFKMELYKNQIERNHTFVASNGKSMPAYKVLSAAIGYMKGHLLGTIKARGIDVSGTEIRWVVTVPAIWSNAAKQMMREAAETAGIPKKQLLLALEPEAASMYCKYLPLAKLDSGDGKAQTFRLGSRYMVLDAGGGTIDITVHEVMKDGYLKELCAVNGGAWGGTKVDEAFEDLLESIVGKDAFKHFKANDISSVIDLRRSFEVKKKTITAKDVGKKTTVTVPCSLLESFKKYNPGKQIADAIKINHSSTDVDWKRDKLRLSQTKALTLFAKSLKHITDHVSVILRQPEVKNCEAILMVGGYSECPLLQDAIRSIAGEIRLIVPSEASLAVLKGAVINGHCPDTLSERICRYTYGISVNMPYGENGYDKYRFVNEDGEIMCDNCLYIFAKKGLLIKMAESSITKLLAVGHSKATSFSLHMFASVAENPKYVTEESCRKIGEITLQMPDTTLGKDRGANVTMYFGGSEIELTAVDKDTGRKIIASFDFLG